MSDDDRSQPDDEFLEMLREMLAGQSGLDASQLAGAAGLPNNPAFISGLMNQLQSAMQNSSGEIDWGVALDQARTIANSESVPTTPADRAAIEQSLHIASLWLAEATHISELTAEPALMSRGQWVAATMPVWIQLAEPVAASIADALSSVLAEQAPEEMDDMLAGASKMVRGVGGALFAVQLGQIVGQLSSEVVSGGDIGIPLLGGDTAGGQQSALLPQNLASFGAGLDIPVDQIQIYVAVRELAHARLFRHAKWLRLQLLSAIIDFSRGIRIDGAHMHDIAAEYNPTDPESLREAISSGALIPPKSDVQLAALARLETMLALIEGWVDVVTAQATSRLPKSESIAETVRRRRAAGGPAESAFSKLVGLELRPRRLREAAALWQRVSDELGADQRDALWSHPDLLPTHEEIDNPDQLIARLTHTLPDDDDLDRALEEILDAGSPGGSPSSDEPDESGTSTTE